MNPNSELTVVRGLLEVCQAWQQVIDAETDPERKDQTGLMAYRQVKDMDYFGTRRLILKSGAALMMQDGLSQEENVWPYVQFGEVLVRGELGEVKFVKFQSERFISWPIFNAQTMDPPQSVELSVSEIPEYDYYLPANRAIQRPLYMPVSMIDLVLCDA